MTASLISVNVGLPKTVQFQDRSVTTGIFKSPVEGPVALRKHNLEGDGQADLSVHGGPTKAVYVYPNQHYTYWREELPDVELGWGNFGENFTVDGMDEESICIGDEFRVGTTRLVVTEPRMPCFKLGVRFGRADMPKRFLQSGRSGFYFGVRRSEPSLQAPESSPRVTTLQRTESYRGEGMGKRAPPMN
jgi:MOSC domain-containing protein YiiM